MVIELGPLASVRQRIIDILRTMTAPENTFYSVMDYIPPDRSDFDNYLILISPKRVTTLPVKMAEIRTRPQTWMIECSSQQVLTGISVVNEFMIVTYADLIIDAIDRFPRLEDPTTRIGLTGVDEVNLGEAVFQTPKSFAEGNPQQQHYTVTFTLQVVYEKVLGC